MPIYDWGSDAARIVERLSEPATLKLGAKVLNDAVLVEGWISHHAAIVGYANMFIADNGSTDPRTLDIYEAYSDRLTIFRFSGPHNEIHWHGRFAPLFDAIRRTAKYFCFVDVDERLVWMDGPSWSADPAIVARLDSDAGQAIVPTTWLINTLNRVDQFSLLDSEDRPFLTNNLKWGKPILPSDLVGVQSGIHNLQYNTYPVSTEHGVRHFLLHLTQFPERRIDVNISKLISRKVIDASCTADDVLAMDFSAHPDKSFMRFVDEIRKMRRLLDDAKAGEQPGATDVLRLEPDGGVTYLSERARSDLQAYIDQGDQHIRSILQAAAP